MREALRGGPQGLAQKIYCERMQIEPSRHMKTLHPWPLLELMLSAKSLGYVDYALAGRLLEKTGRMDESLAALICHLSLASRRGHLCVTIDAGQISPSPEEVWAIDDNTVEGDSAIPIDAMERLSSLIREGVNRIKAPLITEVDSNTISVPYPLCKDGNRYYLQRYWMLESGVIQQLHVLQNGWKSFLDLDLNHFNESLKGAINSGILLKEQAEGILRACLHPISFITGGPGTGKTYTAGVLLRMIWDELSEDKRKSFSAALAAPTGKASANLEASMRRALKDVKGLPDFKGQTLHQLLGTGKGYSGGSVKDVSADLVIVDESSMIDVQMMQKLLGAMKPGSHLVLLGDRHQLASIEAGSLFADLITHFSHQTHEFAQVTELNQCLRAELRTIIELAKNIKSGIASEVIRHFNEITEAAGVRFVEFEAECKPLDLQRKLVKRVTPFYPEFSALPDDPFLLLQEFSRFRLLTPMRQGVLGVEALNEAIHRATEQRLGNQGVRLIPIIIIENDHSLELFNGETGLLFRHPAEDKEKDYALFPSRDNNTGIRRIPLLMLPKYEMAYCMTVHKSQGSEFDHVLLVLGDGAQMFGREGLYTGVTRAKLTVEVWSRPEIIKGMISRQALRHSGVVERLRN